MLLVIIFVLAFCFCLESFFCWVYGLLVSTLPGFWTLLFVILDYILYLCSVFWMVLEVGSFFASLLDSACRTKVCLFTALRMSLHKVPLSRILRTQPFLLIFINNLRALNILLLLEVFFGRCSYPQQQTQLMFSILFVQQDIC